MEMSHKHKEKSWRMTSLPYNVQRIEQQLILQKVYTWTSQFQNASAPSSLATFRKMTGLFKNCWPSSKFKGAWKLWIHLFWPSALCFQADALCRKAEGKADGWFADRIKILPGAQKAGWLLLILLLLLLLHVTHSSRGLCSIRRI